MNYSLMESSLSEVFHIISINIDKVNYLSSRLINPNYNNLEIKQFLNEFEYDLKFIYDILREYKYSFINENNKKHITSGKANIDYLKISDRIKKHLNLNNLEDCMSNNYKDNKNKENKKYNLTINILSDKYFDSKRKLSKKFNKSKSCKSYKKRYPKNLKMNLKGNYCCTEKRNMNNFIEDKKQTYITEYSNDKRYQESNNKFRNNINKNKASFKQLNTLYNYYDELLKKNNNLMENDNYEYNTIPTNRLDLDDNDINYNSPLYKTYNVISSEEDKNNNIIEKDIEDNYNNYRKNNFSYIRDYEKHNNYMKEQLSNRQINNENIKEKIKKILLLIVQDNNILNELKKRFGDDISSKLLEGGFDINEINSIYDFLKRYENIINKNEKDKNLFRGSRNYYRNYKYNNNNNKNDILFLRDSKRDDNKYHDFYDYEYDNNYHIIKNK